MAEQRPDIFSFCTQPDLRLALVELVIGHGVKAIALEKPMANTLAEAREIVAACHEAGVQLIVSHQHKYGGHWQRVKALIDAGELGAIREIHVSSKGWLLHYATHLIDYATWLNGGHFPVRVAAHAHGRGKLKDSHPSPDYLFGRIAFANGVNGTIECGAESADLPPYQAPVETNFDYWMDAGATVLGTDGYAQVIVGHGWRAVTAKSGAIGGTEHRFAPEQDTTPFYLELADCLDDPSRRHTCDGDTALRGHEAMLALCASVVEHRAIALPLQSDPGDVLARLSEVLP